MAGNELTDISPLNKYASFLYYSLPVLDLYEERDSNMKQVTLVGNNDNNGLRLFIIIAQKLNSNLI